MTLYRWVQRFIPLLIDAARPCRHAAEDRWFVDETYVKVIGVWRCRYRAVDQHGHVIDVYVSQRSDIASARRFFRTAMANQGEPSEASPIVLRGHSPTDEEIITVVDAILEGLPETRRR